MTNREYLIGLLSDDAFIDDGGASYEAMVHYNISCPYYMGDERCLCGNGFSTDRELCTKCKEIWLDSEVDE